MEKHGEMPPAYQKGYGEPHAPPPAYNQEPGQQPPYPNNQQAHWAPPPQQPNQYPQYPNIVVQQPMFVPTNSRGPPPPDHMTAAIFATLCCFWPTGVIAIIKANEAKSAWMRGDTTLAHNTARSAKTMVNVSIIAGICSFILLAIIIGVYVGVILNNTEYYSDDDNY